MRKTGRFAPIAAMMLAACGSQQTSQPVVTEEKNVAFDDAQSELVAQSHNYTERDGELYMYVTAVTPEQKERGIAIGDVLYYRYRGKNGGMHTIENVDSQGRTLGKYQCSEPCRIIRIGTGDKPERIPYSPNSLIGSVFDDAINGSLDIAREAPKPKVARVVPAVFVGEWNENPADCGTGNNPSRLRISPNLFRYYETQGSVRSVSVQSHLAATIELAMSGEGEIWEATVKMSVSPSGDALTIGNYTRYRCPQ